MIQFFRKFAIGILLSITLSWLLPFHPVMAQDNNTAKIVLDGYPLFSVNNSGGYTAQQRAREANQLLQTIVNTKDFPISIKIDDSQEFLPVITIDGNHFLTVTYNDLPEGRNALLQAQIWKQRLKEGIERAEYQRTTAYFQQAALSSLIAFIVAIALVWLLQIIWQKWINPWLTRKTVDNKTQVLIIISVHFFWILIEVAVWLFSLNYIVNQFPQTRQLNYYFSNVLIDSLISDYISLGNNFYSLTDFFILIGLLITIVFLGQKFTTIFKSQILILTGLNRATQETIALVANYIFIFIGAIVVLQLWGLDISSLTVFAGVLGVGVALGVQGIAKEFVSGLVLIFDRPVQVGDFVNIGDLMGTVEKMSFRSIEIRTLDNISVILPNSRFLESEVINWNHSTSKSRLKIPVGVAYGLDLTVVRKALMEATKGDSDILSEPQPRVFFTGFGDSSLNFELLIWINEPRKQFQIKSDIYFRIEALLRHRGIEIPFPQRDLHIRSDDLVNAITQLSESVAKWIDKQENK